MMDTICCVVEGFLPAKLSENIRSFYDFQDESGSPAT